MSSVEMFMLVGKNWLINYYQHFEQFNSCCSDCWCCLRRKLILDEFEKKKDFILLILNCWKVYDFLNSFKFFSPCVETTDS